MELNEKIALFCGFTELDYKTDQFGKVQDHCWIEPRYRRQESGHWSFNPPNFLDPEWGIAYLMKWAVPKLSTLAGIGLCYIPRVHKWEVSLWGFPGILIEEEGDNPAEVLAQAIGKYIDSLGDEK